MEHELPRIYFYKKKFIKYTKSFRFLRAVLYYLKKKNNRKQHIFKQMKRNIYETTRLYITKNKARAL